MRKRAGTELHSKISTCKVAETNANRPDGFTKISFDLALFALKSASRRGMGLRVEWGKLVKLYLLIYAALSAPTSLPAQVALAPTDASIAASATGSAILRTGTEVPLRLSEELTTRDKRLRIGQRIRLETAEPIIVQGVVVVRAGSPAIGEITEVTNKGMWGKSGRFSGRVLYLSVNGRQIRLTGAFNDKGIAGGAGAVAVSALVFLPAGFFMTGTSANLPAGTFIKSYIDEDVPLELAATSFPPLTVGTYAKSQSYLPIQGGPSKLKANTPSGYCYDVPQDYVGLGTINKPAITSFSPACSELAKAG